MRQKVELRVIQPKQEGVNNATGQPWTSQEIVIAWPDTDTDGHATENLLDIRLRNEEQDKFEAMNLVVGDTMDVNLQFSTYQSKTGSVYNGIKAELC